MRLQDTGSPFENIKKYEEAFLKYWREHAFSNQPAVSDGELYSKFSTTMNEAGQPVINSGWKLILEDHTCSKLPFRFGKVSQMRLSMNKLATLEGAPVNCNTFSLERFADTASMTGANNVMDSIEHGPEHAEHMSFEFARPLRSLATNLKSPIDSLVIHAPSIVSFAGLNVPCRELTLVLPFQKSISGIHKQLKGVEELALVLDPAFEGGLLGIGMIKGLKTIVRSTNQPIGSSMQPPYERALNVIKAGIKQGWNVHEVQEKMIDAGLGQFARL